MSSEIRPRVETIAQLAQGGSWRLTLQHDRDEHLFLWITRGQGIAHVDGLRRGVGANNALFIPARSLMALDLARQGFGMAVHLPAVAGLVLPDEACHLRVRDVMAQGELAGIIDALQREQSGQRVLLAEAMQAEAARLAIWLRRIAAETPAEQEPRAAARLVRAFAALVVARYASGAPVARYAADLGVTATHLSRACRAVSGLSAGEILAQRTLHAARLALETSGRSVTAIARDLGFSGAPYFSRFIRQHIGAPPSRLRNGSAG